jgi:hypothetical protein
MSSFAWTVILLDIFIEDVYISVTHLEQTKQPFCREMALTVAMGTV